MSGKQASWRTIPICIAAVALLWSAGRPLGAAPAGGGGNPAVKVPAVVFDTISVNYLDPVHFCFLLGMSDLSDKACRWAGLHKTSRGELKRLLPKEIKFISPGEYGSRQLIVAGSPAAISQLRVLIKQVDTQPALVQLSVSLLPGELSDLPGSGANPVPIRAGLQRAGLIAFPAGQMPKPTAASPPITIETTGSNGCRVVLPAVGDWPQMLLTVVPQLAADGGITASITVGLLDGSLPPRSAFARAADDPLLSTLVNLQNEGGLALTLSRPASDVTLLIKLALRPAASGHSGERN